MLMNFFKNWSLSFSLPPPSNSLLSAVFLFDISPVYTGITWHKCIHDLKAPPLLPDNFKRLSRVSSAVSWKASCYQNDSSLKYHLHICRSNRCRHTITVMEVPRNVSLYRFNHLNVGVSYTVWMYARSEDGRSSGSSRKLELRITNHDNFAMNGPIYFSMCVAVLLLILFLGIFKLITSEFHHNEDFQCEGNLYKVVIFPK